MDKFNYDEYMKNAIQHIEQMIKEIAEKSYYRGVESGKREKERAIEYWQAEGYERGLEDAWETAKQIVSISSAKMADIFDEVYAESVFEKFTASEAMQKIKEYEEQEKQKSDNLSKYIYGTTLDELKENNGTWTVSLKLSDPTYCYKADEQEEQTEEEWDSETMSGQLYDVPTEQTKDISWKKHIYEEVCLLADDEECSVDEIAEVLDQMRKESHEV